MPRRHAGAALLGPANFQKPNRVRKLALLLCAAITLGVVLSTPALADPPEPRPFLKVVLLGDSYSAGNGAGEEYYGPNGCWRSTANWAEQYLEHLRSLGYAIFFENRACAGAITHDISNPHVTENFEDDVLILGGNWEGNAALPDHLRSLGWCPENYPDEETIPLIIESAVYDQILASTAVSFHCDRILEPQMEAVGSDTDLVLMTVGGNDSTTAGEHGKGFGSIVRKCFLAGERDASECASRFQDLEQLIASGVLQGRIETALDKLRTERGMQPGSRVVLVQYPYLEAGTGYTLGAFDVSTAIRELGEAVDDEQADAVAAANSDAGENRNVFISGIKPVFAGPPHHEPYGDFTEMNPDRWIYEFERGVVALPGIVCQDGKKGNFLENYHPNLCGHAAIAEVLKPFGSFEIPPTPVQGGDIDVIFVIDTTGSMGGDIAAVKSVASQVVDQLTQDFASYRFALVTYRDHPSWTGEPTDYPSRVDLDFTNETASIVSAINAIQLGDGGDTPESVYSGLLEAIGLDWRPGVKKVVLQFGDAAPHDPEPVTNYTADDVVNAALAVDPAEVYVLNVSGGQAAPQLVDISTRTGGDVFSAPTPSEVAQALTDALQQAAAKPLAVAGGPYIAAVGQSRTLDGSNSVDGDGVIVSYEWDVDGDGDFDTSSAQPTYVHTFSSTFDGAIALRVTDDSGLSSVAMARAHASSDGDEVPQVGDNCPNESNHGQNDYDLDGLGDVCDPNPGFQYEANVLFCDGRQPTIVGTEGDDQLTGNATQDVILGKGGRDVIDGRGGNDVICAGDGNDRVFGYVGLDRLFGEAGNDTLDGGDNEDFVNGGFGDDRLEGGKANDDLYDVHGNDAFIGGTGTSDICRGVFTGDTHQGCEQIVPGG